MIFMNDAANNQTEIAIDVAKPLKIKNDQLLDFVKVQIGDKIDEHQVLAQKKSMFGLGKVEIKSPVSGIVIHVSLDDGVVVVDTNSETELDEVMGDDTKTEKSGDVDKIVEENKSKVVNDDSSKNSIPKELKMNVVDQVNKKFKRNKVQHVVPGIIGFGSGVGVGVYVGDGFDQTVLNPELRGSVLVLNEIPSVLAMFKASAIGVEAIVVSRGSQMEVEALKKELDGKAQISFLMVPEDVDLSKLDGVSLEVREKELVVLGE